MASRSASLHLRPSPTRFVTGSIVPPAKVERLTGQPMGTIVPAASTKVATSARHVPAGAPGAGRTEEEAQVRKRQMLPGAAAAVLGAMGAAGVAGTAYG